MVIPFDAGAGTMTDRTDDLFVETNRFAVLRSDNHLLCPLVSTASSNWSPSLIVMAFTPFCRGRE